MQVEKDMDYLITRARSLLCYDMTEQQAAEQLMKSGASATSAFFAVKAAVILLGDA